MKHRWDRALALMLALMLAVVAMALAEEPATTGDADDKPIEIAAFEQGVESTDTEPVPEEAGVLALGDLLDLPVEEEPGAGNAPEDVDWDGVQTWWFVVGEEAVAIQETREGDEIQQPDDPAAPEGKDFDGWYLEDGVRLFTEDEPVIAHPDPQIPDVTVYARFVAAEEPAMEEPAAEDLTEPSPSEEGAEQSEAEEVVPQNTDEDKPEEGEATASDSPDGDIEEPTPNTLTYTGEAQALVSGEGWLYSLDGESYSEAIPAAIDAGEYTVYFKAAEDAEAQTLTVTIAKADVVFTAPVAATGEE